MRRIVVTGLVAALSLTGTPLFAASPRAARSSQNAGQNLTGNIDGTAMSADGRPLANYAVKVRSLSDSQIAGAATTNASGQFTLTRLTSGWYAIEVATAAGDIVATSAAVWVAAGATASVIVTESAQRKDGAPLLGGENAAAASGSGHGISTAAIVTTAAAAAGVVGVVVAVGRSTASGSR